MVRSINSLTIQFSTTSTILLHFLNSKQRIPFYDPFTTVIGFIKSEVDRMVVIAIVNLLGSMLKHVSILELFVNTDVYNKEKNNI